MERYRSFSEYVKETYGRRLYRLALDGGMTCPNRDGRIAFGGCIFCSGSGSGDFSVKCIPDGSADFAGKAIAEAISRLGKKGEALLLSEKSSFIAYLQAFTNTYAPEPYLRELYTALLKDERIAGLSIGTRPDCLPEEVLSLLHDLKEQFPDKFIWVELGLQTANEKTAGLIRRGYENRVFETAVQQLRALSIPVIVHVILGLPTRENDGSLRTESRQELLETISYVNHLPIAGIKLQQLHILKNTGLQPLYEAGTIQTLTKEEYIAYLTSAIAHLRPDIVIHRLTGDGSREELLSPQYSLNKHDLINSIRHALKEQNITQGMDFTR